MALDLYNTSPTDRWLSLGPDLDYEQTNNQPGRKKGKGWEWVMENGDDAIDVLNSSLCLVNPRRPGCPGDPNMQPVVVNQGMPVWLILVLVVVLLILLLFIFKKAK